MKGDFSRVSFIPGAGFSRVLQQQGRLQLDSDFNESQEIQLRFLRALAVDLIGPYAAVGEGFKISALASLDKNYLIGKGRFYVEGRLCENPGQTSWGAAPGQTPQPWLVDGAPPDDGTYIVYLDVWERSICAAEYDHLLARATPGALREIALGGVDTASRGQLVWQVRHDLVPQGVAVLPDGKMEDAVWEKILTLWTQARPEENQTAAPVLMVKAGETPDDAADPCVIPPRSGYRGLENQLYRVEISRSGRAGTGPKQATFVWSRSNGSDVLAVESVNGATVRLAEGWRDARSAIGPGDHVELSAPTHRLSPGPGPLRRVTHYDPDSATITLDEPTPLNADKVADGVIIRRWDYVARHPNTGTPKIVDDHALEIVENKWLTLEDGIAIYFGWPPSTATAVTRPLPAYYRAGDYWLFEARVDLGDVVWPRHAPDQPEPMTPHGVERHYAPLAEVAFTNNGKASVNKDLRRIIKRVFG
jgi:hypothetical protein